MVANWPTLTELDENAARTFATLAERLNTDTPDLEWLDAYYHGVQRLSALGMAVPPEMERLSTVVNWPRLVVDSIEERLDIEGFRYPGQAAGDERLWSIWQANNLDENSQLAHIDALTYGRAFVLVQPPMPGDTVPVITVESARHLVVDTDPIGRFPRAALKVWSDVDGDRATLWLPGRVVTLFKSAGGWTATADVTDAAPVVPVIPLYNRSRVADLDGETEMADVMPLTDAVCRSITVMQAAAELAAVPQRYVFGATESDFKRPDGTRIPAWEAYMGRIWAMANAEGKAGSFPAADLRNFTAIIDAYARIVSALSGLPPHYLGFSSDNPASADAIRSSEGRLVKRAERKQRMFGGSWETVMRLALLLSGDPMPTTVDGLETVWRDPSTPTFASKADAVVKLVQAGVYPVSYAPEALGLSQAERARIELLRRAEDGAEVDRLMASAASLDAPEPADTDTDAGPVPAAESSAASTPATTG